MSLRSRFVRYLQNLTGDTVYSDNARMAAMDRAAARFAETCELCLGTAVYLCPKCREPISTHSHENDYLCEAHGFVNPIRQHDGARISGDGRCGALRVS